ncbi:MAG TPA: YdcF family protein [Phycisphaerae bacterium]|nr:YdcF family protein [Phycisphaerae bacterium]
MLNPFPLFLLLFARALSLFLGLFTLLNIAGSWVSPGFDANGWWIDTGFLPWQACRTALLLGAAALITLGMGRPASLRPWARGIVAGLAAVTLWNAILFYVVWKFGWIAPGLPIPLSLLLTLTLAFIAKTSGKPVTPQSKFETRCRARRSKIAFFALSFLAALLLFPLAQMYCFGTTDYRRNADAIVVFGARAYADGTASQALADRTNTAIALYREKRAPLLIFSGGPGDGATSEPQAMRALARAAGIPDSAILLDEQGLNTEATVANTTALFQQHHIKKALAVSHDYHLPRVKLAYARALAGRNIEIFTVPACEPFPLTARPRYMAREVIAFWAYYLRPLRQ